MTETRGWIWPKPTNVICLNLTENWQQWMFTLWTWRKRIEFDRKSKIFGFQSHSLVHVCRCSDIYRMFVFRSYSTDNVCRYGKYKLLFWSSSHCERLSLSVFGHVHRFRSYSFGHLHSVKLTTLLRTALTGQNIFFAVFPCYAI